MKKIIKLFRPKTSKIVKKTPRIISEQPIITYPQQSGSTGTTLEQFMQDVDKRIEQAYDPKRIERQLTEKRARLKKEGKIKPSETSSS